MNKDPLPNEHGLNFGCQLLNNLPAFNDNSFLRNAALRRQIYFLLSGILTLQIK